MAYYCFLCNDNHDGSPTEEHFIPRSIDGPEHQWLPACEARNSLSNSVFDNDVRDLLYLIRYQNTSLLKRSGEALLADGALKPYKFSIYENTELDERTALRYIYDRDTNSHIPHNEVYAIKFRVGLTQDEKETFCRGLAKMSIGALAYLLKDQGVEDATVRELFSQRSIDEFRRFALKLQPSGETAILRFSLGRSDVLTRLQRTCENQQVRNHVLKVVFKDDNSIHVEGMLYSQYGWVIDLSNQFSIKARELRLENSIAHMNVPASLRDTSQSLDSIVFLNPDFKGQNPSIPNHWKNS